MGTFERISPNPKHPRKQLSREKQHKSHSHRILPEEKQNFFPNSRLEPDMQYALLSILLFPLAANCRNILSSEASVSEEVARYALEVDADYPTQLVEQAVTKAQSVVQNFLKEQQELEGKRREKRSARGCARSTPRSSGQGLLVIRPTPPTSSSTTSSTCQTLCRGWRCGSASTQTGTT